MIGTIRSLDVEMQDKLHADLRRTAIKIGESMNAKVTVDIQKGVPVTYNHLELTEKATSWLNYAAGEENVKIQKAITGAEDFSFFAQKAPGLFIFLGGSPPGTDLSKVAYNHSPRFQIDESALNLGVRTMTQLTLDYMEMNAK